MNQDEIRAIAQQAYEEVMKQSLRPQDKEHVIAVCTRFLVAIAEKAEPVAWLVRDQVDGLRYPCNQKNPAGSIDGESEPLFTHPAIEPAPTVDSAISQLVAALQESKGWLRDYADAIIRDAIDRTAAPLPDEVREIVERLRAYPTRDGLLAAEMIERLARQVPEGCAVVQRKVTEDTKCVLATPGNYRTYQDQWTALIAAGEVKP